MSDINPYTSPQSDVSIPTDPISPVINKAGAGLRFANFVIDYIAQIAIGFVIGLGLGLSGILGVEPQPLIEIGISLIALLLYYTIMEGFLGVTVGKLITQTRVVMEDGSRPTFKVGLLRSLCRLIPFEAFSFLGSEARGWHDSITKTYVVKNKS